MSVKINKNMTAELGSALRKFFALGDRTYTGIDGSVIDYPFHISDMMLSHNEGEEKTAFVVVSYLENCRGKKVFDVSMCPSDDPLRLVRGIIVEVPVVLKETTLTHYVYDINLKSSMTWTVLVSSHGYIPRVDAYSVAEGTKSFTDNSGITHGGFSILAGVEAHVEGSLVRVWAHPYYDVMMFSTHNVICGGRDNRTHNILTFEVMDALKAVASPYLLSAAENSFKEVVLYFKVVTPDNLEVSRMEFQGRKFITVFEGIYSRNGANISKDYLKAILEISEMQMKKGMKSTFGEFKTSAMPYLTTEGLASHKMNMFSRLASMSSHEEYKERIGQDEPVLISFYRPGDMREYRFRFASPKYHAKLRLIEGRLSDALKRCFNAVIYDKDVKGRTAKEDLFLCKVEELSEAYAPCSFRYHELMRMSSGLLIYFDEEFEGLPHKVQNVISSYRPPSKRGCAIEAIRREGMEKAFPPLPNIVRIWGSPSEKTSKAQAPSGCKRAEAAKAVRTENPGFWE